MSLARMVSTRPVRLVVAVAVLFLLLSWSVVSCVAAVFSPPPPAAEVTTRPAPAAERGAGVSASPTQRPTRAGSREGGEDGDVEEGHATVPPPVTHDHGDDAHPEASAEAISGCAQAAAEFGVAYAARPGDTPQAWLDRVGPYLMGEVADEYAQGSRVVDMDALPAGVPVDVAVVVDDGACEARVEFPRGGRVDPVLRVDGGGWRVASVGVGS